MYLHQSEIDQIIDFMDINDDQYRPEYSGRFMYGRTSPAFIVPVNDLAKLATIMTLVIMERDDETSWPAHEATDIASAVSTDNMADDIVVYWTRGLEVKV